MAQPLILDAARAREIVVWASIDPSDGGIGLYPSNLAANFENKLAAFTLQDGLAARLLASAQPSGEAEVSAVDELLKTIRTSQGEGKTRGGTDGEMAVRKVPPGWVREAIEVLEGAPFAYATARMG